MFIEVAFTQEEQNIETLDMFLSVVGDTTWSASDKKEFEKGDDNILVYRGSDVHWNHPRRYTSLNEFLNEYV